MLFVINGRPVTKKNSQRIMRGKNGQPFVAQSVNAKTWEENAIIQLRTQLYHARQRGPVAAPLGIPVNLRALVYRERATGDLGNFLSAVCDALERAGVVTNDRLILGFDGSRLRIDRERPRVEIELTALAG